VADPIAAQFRPNARELEAAPDELADPIGDEAHTPVKGVVHRYRDRCLLKLVHVCPVYCRFCFRREMVGSLGDGTLTGAELDEALGYIAAHPELWEVILTGGDPFLISARRAREITERLAAISHVKIIRWHTRVPVVDPLRVTPDLVTALRADGATTYVVLHTNHPHELTEQARAAIARIVDAGVPMLSQTVLLKGVNDDADTLEALMRALVEARVKPYYLHHLARHIALPLLDRARASACAGVARSRLRPRAADLRARHSGRSWQGAADAAERAQDRRWLHLARQKRRVADVRGIA
jgi:lysine 2,3-aminomutase